MNSEKEKVKQCLFEAMEADVAKLREQAVSSEPHVFSQEFEAKMQVIIDSVEKKSKRLAMMRKIAVASAAALVLAVGGISISTSNVTASKSVVDIVAWVKEYFNFEKGDDAQRVDGILFEESRIGYIPEGFEKVGEIATFSSVKYEYASKNGGYIIVRATRDKTSAYQDSTGVENAIGTSDAGFEYTYVFKEDIGHIYIWEGTNDLYYILSGTATKDIMEQVMNGIKD